MSTIKVNNIQNANGTSAIAIDSSGVATFSKTLVPSSSMMYRNIIINGDMRIAQRGTSFTGLTGGNNYTSDRFLFQPGAGTWSLTQDTDVPTGQGFVNSVKIACTSTATLTGAQQVHLGQTVEAQNLQHLKYGTSNAEYLTLSFWVKSNKTGTFEIWLYQADDGRQLTKTYTISSADTWEQKTLTVIGDTTGVIDNDNGAGLYVRWILDTGPDVSSGTAPDGVWEAYNAANSNANQGVYLADSTSNYINITGVQLEVGDAATPFEHRPYDAELARCYRYYEKSGLNNAISWSGDTTNGATYWDVRAYMIEKRTTPTITVGTEYAKNGFGSAPSISWEATRSFRAYTAANATTSGGYFVFGWTAESEL